MFLFAFYFFALFLKAYYRVDESMSETEDHQTDISSELLPTANVEESDEKLKDSPSVNTSNIGKTVVVSVEESDKELKDSLSVSIISDVVQAG